MPSDKSTSAGLSARVCNHSFRATGITNYLENGGQLEIAAQMAAHESTRSTGFYDRRSDLINLDEVERIRISKGACQNMEEDAMAITQQSLGKRLQDARGTSGLSKVQSAHAIGILPERLAAIESGEQSVNSLEIHRLSKLYKTTLHSLLNGADESQP
jgi:ribosome-binding protein aMBF1 (putative translation factor)